MNSHMVVGSWAAEPEQYNAISGVSSPSSWLIHALGGEESDSGIRVNHTTVLTSGPVYQAVTLIASALAMLPVEVFRTSRDKDDKRVDKLHDVHRIFNIHGNDEMTPYTMRQTLIGWALLHGNGLGVIERRGNRAVGVYPLQPGSVWAERIPSTPDMDELGLAGDIVYRYTLDNGTTGTLFRREVFHLKLFGSGLWGYSPLSLFNNLFGKGLAVNKFQGRTFSNAARPSGVLEKQYGPGIPTRMDPEARANLRREWEDMHTGLDNTGKVAILTDGLKWTPLSVTSEQAQMIESLRFHREEVAAIYNLPPHKLGAMENSAVRANIEEQNRSYVEDSLMPIGTAFEQECRDKLCTDAERRLETCEIRINYKQRLRADHKTRNEAYATGRTGGWLSVNDIRRAEDLPDVGDKGNVYLVPSNMADAETREPFTGGGSTREPLDEEPAARFLLYARKQLQVRHDQEAKALSQGITRKRGFDEFCVRYYESMEQKLFESFAPLEAIDGFVNEDAMRGIIREYCHNARMELVGVTDAKQLAAVLPRLRELGETILEQVRHERVQS